MRAALPRQARAELVRHVDDGDGVAVAAFVRQEEPALGAEVVLEVLVVVEVVAREVAEDDRVEVDAGGAVLGEGVRADLERARPVPRLRHLPEHALQVEGLRRGELDRVLDPADAVDDRAEQPGRLSRGGEQAGHEVRRGRLAVRPGDADDAELARGVAVPARRHQRHRPAHRRDDDLRHAALRCRARTRAPRRRPPRPRRRTRGRRTRARGRKRKACRRRRHACGRRDP